MNGAAITTLSILRLDKENPLTASPQPRIDHRQWEWDEELADDLARLVRLAIRADLDRGCDVTSVALLPPDLVGRARIMARQPGVLAGLAGVPHLLEEFDVTCHWEPECHDGEWVESGAAVGSLSGRALDLLVLERTLLNYLSHLCGIASKTRQFVRAIEGTSAVICDTRKTVPGWQRLAKYAVRCGGGTNHRTGLFDALLIKDNHLAALGTLDDSPSDSAELAAAAVTRARQAIEELAGGLGTPRELVLQIEVDDLAQLKAVLPASPDAVLLDNFSLDDLRQAVSLRNTSAPHVVLEASGGITLESVRAVAETGVDRISVGALTHSVKALDLALDWEWVATGGENGGRAIRT